MPTKNNTASGLTFKEFCAKIAEFVANNAKKSYLNPEDISGQWRTTVPYSEDFEKELIRQAKLFIILIPSKDLMFLKSVATRIAEFLAVYAMGTNNKTTHHISTERIFDQIYNKSKYIQGLTAKKQKKYERKHSCENSVSNQYEQVKKRARIKQNIINITVYNFQR